MSAGDYTVVVEAPVIRTMCKGDASARSNSLSVVYLSR